MASDFTAELKAVYTRVSAYSTDPEPIDDLKLILSFVKGLRNSESEETRNTLVSALPLLVNFLLTNKKYVSVHSMMLAAEIIDEIISLFPVLYTFSKYLEAFRTCSDPSAYLYEQCLQDPRGGSWGIPPQEIPDTLKEWRSSLVEDMKIDAVKVDNQYEKKVWAKGKILKINSSGELIISFENENSDITRVLQQDSHEIAPYNTKSSGDE